MNSLPRKLYYSLPIRIWDTTIALRDHMRVAVIQGLDRWPCRRRQNLVVGCESSGTTIVSKLLYCGSSGRFFDEGLERWVWRAYMSIYKGESRIEDYPRLQLFDNVKVPGFAAILPQYHAAFPNSRIVYVVRDPRDILASAYRTWELKKKNQLAEVSWIREKWLGITASDPVERLATRWLRYLVASRQIEGVRYVRYEDFCQSKADTICQLCDDMGIPFDERRTQELANEQASSREVRSYCPQGPGNWKSSKFINSVDIATIESVCGNEMAEWDYL